MRHVWKGKVEEDWAALHIYLTLGASPVVDDPGVIALDEAMMDSTRKSIVSRVRNFAYLDTGSGLPNAAAQTIGVWEEYADDIEQGSQKARAEYERLTGMALG